MLALDRKLFRDLNQMKGQLLAIALVIGCGIATFVMSRSMLHSLEITQQSYYDRYQFGDVFATLKRAPDSLTDRIAEIPGVARAQTRIVEFVNLDVPGLAEPTVGKLISIPDSGLPQLNRLYLRRGRFVAPLRDDEVVMSEVFAEANQLDLGDTFRAVINGRRKELRIVGIALSPEYIFETKPGDIVPDNKHFGVIWMGREALAMAFDLESAFNDVSLRLMRGASLSEVIHRLDILLEPYGGLGAYGRKDQISHYFLTNDMEGLRTQGRIAPAIFLAVAAFLLNVVLTRTISMQREQIAALKAFGYSNLEVGWHYLKLVLVISVFGFLLGVGGGTLLGRDITKMFAVVYHFPELTYRLNANIVGTSAIVSATAAILGAIGAVLRAVTLPPAEAMRPEPPTNYRPTIIERIGLGNLFPSIATMVLRQLERHPLKTGLSVLAVGLAVAVLIVGAFIKDSVDFVIDSQFFDVERYDMMVTMTDAVSAAALHEITSIPGITYSEPMRAVSVRFRARHRNRRGVITGLPAQRELFALVNLNGLPAELPPEGLVVSRKLAEVLAVRVGDSVRVEVLERERPVGNIPIVALLEDVSGLNAYMDIRALGRFMRDGDLVSAAFMRTDETRRDEVYHALKETPRVAGVTVKEHGLESFRDTIAGNILKMRLFNLMFAVIIAMGVVYNSARISLSERSRELATLRVIGFTRVEISFILLGELAVITLLAIPVGLLLGYCFAALMCYYFELELFRFPLIISRATYGLATTVVLAAAIISGLLVRRRLDHLDLIAVLKARE